ncbi:MAG: non-ribosomal peptide synthetase, partial [Anaerolineales bacterium]|nr:non-ribosomal peptide synthetase [Anaerolineales bacterium]
MRQISETQRERSVTQLSGDEARQSFNLTDGPLLRVTLFWLDQHEHILLLNMHHVISDAWSLGVLGQELVTLYRGFVSGSSPQLPELSVQYADFAAWQRSWLAGLELERQLGYWREQLAGAPAVLDLPIDRLRLAVQSSRGAFRSLGLSPELSAAVLTLARREGVTLFMVLLGSFAALLSRFFGSGGVVVGSPIANRNRTEIEGLIGFFVNTLVLRTDL